MSKKSFIVVFLLFTTISFCQNPFKYKGFSGGMMIHSGYLKTQNFNLISNSNQHFNTIKAQGFPFGLGGAGRVHLGSFLRIGGEGYVSDLKYGENGSNISVSWGGILVDVAWQNKYFTPFAGITLGGGRWQNITLTNEVKDDFIAEENVGYRTNSFFALSPFIGVEYALSNKIRLTLKADYLINLNNSPNDFAKGIRLFFGFMFYRLKTE
ncbi:MAG: hypothetical protein UHM19_05645 [Bacteroidales bacterium]|nr:hypothetical protein [Bacteroidales bacterium]